MSEEIKPHHLRGIASDIDEMNEPLWAKMINDTWRAAAAMLEIKDARIAELEADLATFRRDASQQTATDEMVRRLQHLGDWQAADRIEALEARIAELEAALAGITAWVAEWTDHVGSCSHKNETCTCGRAFNLHEARAALAGGKDGRD